MPTVTPRLNGIAGKPGASHGYPAELDESRIDTARSIALLAVGKVTIEAHIYTLSVAPLVTRLVRHPGMMGAGKWIGNRSN